MSTPIWKDLDLDAPKAATDGGPAMSFDGATWADVAALVEAARLGEQVIHRGHIPGDVVDMMRAAFAPFTAKEEGGRDA